MKELKTRNLKNKVPKVAISKAIFLLALSLSFIGFVQKLSAQNTGDSITHINCLGADTILAGMVVSDNGIIQYTTNHETGVYNTVTGKKLGTTGAHTKLVKDTHNNIWQAQGNSISKLNEKGNIISQFDIPAEYMSGRFKVSDIAVDLKGNIWVATNSGLLLKTTSGWNKFTAKNSSLLSNHVRNIKVDPKNNKWIITDSGINILGDTICGKCDQWTILNSATSGLPLQMTKSIAFNNFGSAFLGTYYGSIFRYTNGYIDTLPVCQPNKFNTMISSMAFDNFGNLWVGTWGIGLLKISPDGTNYLVYNTYNSSLGNNNINTVFAAKDSMIYIGTAGTGIYKIKPLKNSSGSTVEAIQSNLEQPHSQLPNSINVFPNPSPGIFNIKSGNPGVFDVTISDISGKIIKVIHDFNIGQSSSLDLSDQSAGIYFLNFNSKTFSTQEKITIQK